MENVEIVEVEKVKKPRYTEAQKRAVQKYRERNREKYNAANRVHTMNYYNKNKDNDDFKQKNRERFRRYYQKKKLEKNNIENSENKLL